jgi:hypothetical protein
MVRLVVSVPGHRAGLYLAERVASHLPIQRQKAGPLEGN